MSLSTKPRAGSPIEGELAKAATSIRGFDELTGGGLPRGRTTLVTGGAGSGKSLFGIEFLVRGARAYGEPGVLLTFEETEADLRENVASLGFDRAQLERDGLLVIDAMHVDATEIVTTGAFDLDGLFIRLANAVDEVGAKRVVLELIDLVENPKLAKGDEIIAVPTLVRRLPEPIRKIIGVLSDTEKVLVGLQLRPEKPGAP